MFDSFGGLCRIFIRMLDSFDGQCSIFACVLDSLGRRFLNLPGLACIGGDRFFRQPGLDASGFVHVGFRLHQSRGGDMRIARCFIDFWQCAFCRGVQGSGLARSRLFFLHRRGRLRLRGRHPVEVDEAGVSVEDFVAGAAADDAPA
jgi:hypothetical protein